MDSITDERGQRRLARLVGADREATLTQMTTLYSCGEQKNNSECTTCPNLRWMDYNSRPCQPKTENLWLRWAHTHQNWTAEDLKTHGLNESRFLLMHTDGEVRIWHRLHESTAPTCLESTVQAAGVGVIGIKSVSEHLDATAWVLWLTMCIQYMVTDYPSSAGHF